MSVQITTAHIQGYKQGVDLLVQQKGSRLRGAVRLEPGLTGKRVFFDQIGATAVTRLTTRHADTVLVDTPHARRAVDPVDYVWADMIDEIDKVRVLNDPTNAYSQNAAFAMGRAMDTEILAAAIGNAQTDETGSTATPLGAGQAIAVGGTNLTVAKLRTAKRLLDAAENDPSDPRHIAINALMLESLLGETETTSSDFNTVKALVQGEINTFLGFQFHRTELLTNDATPSRLAVAWRQSGVALGVWKDTHADIGPRRDKNNDIQVLYRATCGATRMEEVAVVTIACAE